MVTVTDVVAAVTALHQTIKLLVQAGNFRQAADREKEVSLELLHGETELILDRQCLRTRRTGHSES